MVGACPGRAWHCRGHARPFSVGDASQVPARWPAARSCGRHGWSVFGNYRRLAERPNGQSTNYARGAKMTILLDPTSERTVAGRTLTARPSSLKGKVVGLLDISKPRGDVFLDRIAQRLASD